jgi:hypothetical protein
VKLHVPLLDPLRSQRAKGGQVDAVAEKMIAEKKIRFDRAKDLVEEYSKKR